MLRFKKYSKDFLPDIISVFRSNVPLYFFSHEEQDLIADLPDFEDTYFVMLLNECVIGSGGYALNPDGTVALCWGMVHSDYLKQGFGKALLEFRLNEIAEYYPGKTLVNSTSQHTAGFFEKYGFRTSEIVKDGFGRGLDLYKMELKTN